MLGDQYTRLVFSQLIMSFEKQNITVLWRGNIALTLVLYLRLSIFCRGILGSRKLMRRTDGDIVLGEGAIQIYKRVIREIRRR